MRQLAIVCFGLLLISCQTKVYESEKALWSYVTDVESGLVQSKHVRGVDFKLIYRPTDVLVKQELTDPVNKKEVERLRKKYNEYLYFNLIMTKNGQELLNHKVGNQSEFTDLVNLLSFGFHEKVHLYDMKKDTVALADYSYPRMYGTSGGTNILLIYPRTKKMLEHEYLVFTIEDLGFNTGEVRFKIPVEPIQNQPKLNFIKI